MKLSKSVFGVLSVVAINVAFASAAFAAEQRVIEETLIYKDPTVAGAGKWIVGGALEGMYTFGPYKIYNTNNLGTEKGQVRAWKPGVDIFAGYGDFTVNYAYRSGNNNMSVCGNICRTLGQRQTENEFIGRWLIRGLAESFTPYLYLGYADMKSNDSSTITTPGFIWTYNGSATMTSTTKHKGTMLGVGGIVPMSEKWGFRIDGGLISTRATWTRSDGASVSGSGTGGRVTGTAYYNFAEGWNGQLGGRWEAYNGGNAGSRNLGGIFGMLGYTFR